MAKKGGFMSKRSFAIGQFLGRNWWVVAIVVGMLAFYALLGSSIAPNDGSVVTKPGLSPTEKLASETLKKIAQPDPCQTGQSARFEKAGQLLKENQFDAATDLLYACINTLSVDEKALYVKALTLANAERSRVADAEAKALKIQKKKEGVRLGMSQQDVLDSNWGRPERVNTTTTKYGVHQQWVYNRSYLYFEDGVLTSIQN